mgnify:CR=1 FL=1
MPVAGATLNRPPSALRSQDVTALVQAQAPGVVPGHGPGPNSGHVANPHILKADEIKSQIQLLKVKSVDDADYLGAERYKVAH